MKAVNLFVPTFDTLDSYGRLADELSVSLTQAGWQITEVSLSGDAQRRRPPTTGGGILVGIPPIFPLFPALSRLGVRVALTMFESTRIPLDWIAPLNQCDAVIVPSPFLIEAFRETGITIPIHVVPLGISPAFHAFQPRPTHISEDAPFTVLAIADRGQRKNWLLAAQAFNKAFDNDPRYRLILKSRTGGMDIPILNPNIEVIAEDYTDAQMCALYHRAHVMLFPTRGEGFGFPPREFVATGGVALATAWGGTADDLPQWGVPIAYTLEEAYSASLAWAHRVGQWARPLMDPLAEQLRDIAATYATYAADAPQRAAFVTHTYSWQRFGEEVGEIYARYRTTARAVSPAPGW